MINIHGKWYKGRLIVDFDGVLCVYGSKDYSQSIPYEISIQNINKAYYDGWYIIIFTARYMTRCKGNVELAKQMGQKVSEDWLRKHGVFFNEVILGKPSGDIYIDDRACRIEGVKGEEDWSTNFWPLIKQKEQDANIQLWMPEV